MLSLRCPRGSRCDVSGAPSDHLSPGGAAMYRSCPAKWFKNYVERHPRKPASIEIILGSYVHRVLERVMLLEPYMRTFDEAKRIAADVWDGPDGYDIFGTLGPEVLVGQSPETMYDDMREFKWSARWCIEAFFSWYSPAEAEVYETEVDLTMELGDVPFVGYADLVTHDVLDYKGLALDTPIPTPSGWTTMGDIREGDLVFGVDGRSYPVIGKSEVHDRPCFRVAFDDGSSVITDDEHLWEVHKDRGREILATRDLMENLTGKNGRDCRIPMPDPLSLPESDLRVDPWVLGYWLGNGAKRSGLITYGDETVEEVVVGRGYSLGVRERKEGSLGVGATVLGLVTQLKTYDLIYNKHVPEVYLRASASQRLDLLCGLMDSDGTWNPLRSQAIFTNLDRGLAESVYELAVSLGQRASWWEGKGQGYGKVVHQYRVSFRPDGIVPFLTRKAKGVSPDGSYATKRRVVRSAVPVDRVPTACISVASPSNLYLCGRQMVPTHNTGEAPEKGKPWTAGREREKLEQPLLYAAALREKGIRVQEAHLLFLSPHGRSGWLSAEATDEALDGAVERLQATWRLTRRDLARGGAEAHTGPLCGWCDFLAVCPDGQREVRVRIRMGKNVGPGADIV